MKARSSASRCSDLSPRLPRAAQRSVLSRPALGAPDSSTGTTKSTATAASASSPPVHATGASEQAVLDRRKALYETAHAACPQRWPRGTRNWDRIDSVSLNTSQSSSEEKRGDSQKAAVNCD